MVESGGTDPHDTLKLKEKKKNLSKRSFKSRDRCSEASGRGQLERDFKAAAFAVGSTDGAVVQCDDAGGDGEAEAGAS